MARIVTSGFELRDNALTTPSTAPDGKFNSGNMTIDTGTVRSGSASLKGNIASGATAVSWTFTAVASGVDSFARVYIYVPTGSLPVGGRTILIGMGPSAEVANVSLETDGTLTLWALIGGTTWTQEGSASSAITLDDWNRVELRLRIGSGSVDQVEARLEGSSFASATGIGITDSLTADLDVGVFGAVSGGSPTSGIVYFDDVALNDGSGASQNSWPGDSKIVLLRPTADNAVGTGWTLGNGTATGGNAWSRLNQVGPTAATDLTTQADAAQIRNATSNANVNYDATMTTYTAAGASGTVNVVVPIVLTGAPVVTSAKAGTVGVVSNPAIANVSLGAGGTSGAFWAGVAVGLYPSGNKWSFGTTTYAPTVTLGTAPVMRVTQVTASTRIAVVTEMGIYVDYTPAVIIPPTPLVHQSVPFYPRPSSPS